MSTELGKDLNSALALFRKHEGFENDLVALEAQLQVLVEDSVKLQTKYPGDNATAIAQQQSTVVEAWNNLKENSAHRSDQLAASCDLQTFLTQVRDLMLWASNLRATLQAEEHVSDAAGASNLKLQHDSIYGEIEAREEKFRALSELSDSMVQTGHYAAVEVEEKCTALLDERQKLHNAWNNKKILLEQKIDLFCFLRDAKQIDNISCIQEAALTSSDVGVTVEDVQDNLKRHDELEKLIQQQDEKVAILQDHGSKLITQNHFDSPNIKKRLAEVKEKRNKIKKLAQLRRNKLTNSLLYTQFARDVAETKAWIIDKQKKIESNVNSFSDDESIEEKVKKLQKYQAFRAEITANQGRIDEIIRMGEILADKNSEVSVEVKEALKTLLDSWNNLLKAVDAQGKGLEEAQDILEFNNQMEKIEAWIRNKESMVQASDTGKDLEHCNALRRKLDDTSSDVDEQRIKSINILADKLLSQDNSANEHKNVEKKRNNFNSRWRHLQGAITAYRNLLNGAYEIHLFNRDVDDTKERIAEKALIMSSDDYGRDLFAVEALRRKQDALERDMTAVKQKIFDLENEASKLMRKYPERADEINNKLLEIKESWDSLESLSVKRRQHLENGYHVNKFLSSVNEIQQWANDIINKMKSIVYPNTIQECVIQLELHAERKAEIDGRKEIFGKLIQESKELIEVKGIISKDIESALKSLEETQYDVLEVWETKNKWLNDVHQLQLFKELADQKESWIANKEAFINNDDLGDSYTSVDKLIKKHEAFEKLLFSSSSGIIGELQEFSNKTLAREPDINEIDIINARLNDIKARMDKLKLQSNQRRTKLEESLALQQFLRNLYEVERWLNQKNQIATDECYKEPSNLQSKIQKHSVFDAELLANSSRISSIIAEGENLIDAKHFASNEIQQQLELVETEWSKLQDASRIKKIRLVQAYDALIFLRSIDELNSWMDEIETQLSSEDYGMQNNIFFYH